MTIQLERLAVKTAVANIPEGIKKCRYRGTVESKLQENPDYIFYGSMQTHCRKCNGYKPKCPGYIA